MKLEIKHCHDGGVIVIKETRGTVKAIRYARGMTDDMIRDSMKRNPPTRNDWKPYNTTFDIFMD